MEYLIERNAPFTLDTQFVYRPHGKLGTPLSVAAESECLSGVQLLLRSQRLFAMYDPQHLHFALSIAIQKRNIPIIEALIAHGGSFKLLVPTSDLKKVTGIQEEKLPPISYAVECGDIELLIYLSKHIDMEENDHPDFRHFVSPLIRAVQNRSLLMAYTMMQLGWTPNPSHKRQVLPLGEAAALGYINVIEFLIDWLADIHETDSFGRAALDRALINENEEVVDLLLSYFPRINELTFRSVISSGSVQGLRWLLQKGVYMEGHLPGYGLCEAISQNNEELVRVFLEQPRVKMMNDKTARHALICAVERDDIPMVRMLLAVGNSPAVAWNNDNMGPEISAVALHAAIVRQNIEIVQLLLSHGAKPNIPSHRARSALFSALPMRNVELIRLLLKHGASVHVLSDAGERVIDAALKTGSDEIVAAVVEYSADKARLPVDVLSRIKLIEARSEAIRPDARLAGKCRGSKGVIRGSDTGLKEVIEKKRAHGQKERCETESEKWEDWWGELDNLVEINGEFSLLTPTGSHP